MTTAKKSAKTNREKPAPKSMPAEGKDPKGGLTAKGRAFFKAKEGSNLRPGVTGSADTPEKMLRKGSFLRRHYANPRGPVVDGDGKPTRQALQAAAWGEPVPKSKGDEKKLATKGSQLLDRYHQAKSSTSKTASRAAGKKATKKSTSKTSPTRS